MRFFGGTALRSAVIVATTIAVGAATPAGAHTQTIKDKLEPGSCSGKCSDIVKAQVTHVGAGEAFRFTARTKRAIKYKSPYEPRFEVLVGKTKYVIAGKVAKAVGTKKVFKVVRESEDNRDMTFLVKTSDLGSSTFRWRALIRDAGHKKLDTAPGKGTAKHGTSGAAAPPAQQTPKLVFTGAVNGTLPAHEGGCGPEENSDGTQRWSGAWSADMGDYTYLFEIFIDESDYNGAGTYTIRGNPPGEGDDPPQILTDSFARLAGTFPGDSFVTVEQPEPVVGTVTINPDLKSGSVDNLRLARGDGAETTAVTGTFSC